MSAPRDRRLGWLAELKPGDRVIVDPPQPNLRTIRTVGSITPTGRINLVPPKANPGRRDQFGPDGMTGDIWYRFRLAQLTPELEHEVRAAHHRHRLLGRVRRVKWGKVPTARIEPAHLALGSEEDWG